MDEELGRHRRKGCMQIQVKGRFTGRTNSKALKPRKLFLNWKGGHRACKAG